DLFLRAADRRFVSVERVVATERLLDEGPLQSLIVNRTMVDGVVEAPNGAHFTECPPDYDRDEAFQREYAATANDPAAWEAFRHRYVDVDEATYQATVRAGRATA
ncbi:MAG: acyl CoA--acetate/3-ketoacid CoA transferase subunit alpha, partial [Actinobacteria bacterium]|nr:acyl CoA--acetate/3-ketoacid CoA transferase subunit alpha [Actinomycetota bacterium]NIS29677.1 acyl CoA--acetate/3-ketoacid CoA transferase subunit alpha [Actinomycetota bacterium]NIT94662.1 acyl CoA--acetate/3-ketoacid CoA transferase subunit alpha [Actinomycetota bacterium]NIU18286.1 acyl CoA--acetate/3-ketoacid CoA transferase subunit alpha [Actinomycetota bacterium]NIU64999.1 acyl CoA--acetate/3-ketoacid CoA transferase subunit alpha [Actinomycetota bacterium]